MLGAGILGKVSNLRNEMDQTQSAQQTSTSPQSPVADLQPTGVSAQQTGSNVQAGGVAGSQESLLGSQLRVGDSQTLVGVSGQAGTSAAVATQSVSFAWLMMFIPLVLLVVIFWPRKDRQDTGFTAEKHKQADKAEQVPQQQPSKKPKKSKKVRR